MLEVSVLFPVLLKPALATLIAQPARKRQY